MGTSHKLDALSPQDAPLLTNKFTPTQDECAPPQDDAQDSMVDPPCKLEPKLWLLLKPLTSCALSSLRNAPKSLSLLLLSSQISQVKNEPLHYHFSSFNLSLAKQ